MSAWWGKVKAWWTRPAVPDAPTLVVHTVDVPAEHATFVVLPPVPQPQVAAATAAAVLAEPLPPVPTEPPPPPWQPVQEVRPEDFLPPSYPGWLSPSGVFIGLDGKGHGFAAFRILEPTVRPEAYDPSVRDYERELEERYAKLTVNAYWSGWSHVARLTRAQRDFIADWHLERQRVFPEWLQQLYD
jgi:hypothetical protein